MRRGSSRGLLSLGLIGIGPSWERRYRPAVRRLSDRLCIRAVHDPVLSRAQSAAQEMGAEVATGLRQLFEDPCIQGVLVLDAGWYGLTPVELACLCQKPLFFGANWCDAPADWQRLAECAQARGVMLVPELSWRFHPSTTRLRELIASRLGPVRQLKLQIRSRSHAGGSELDQAVAAAIDWCSYVTRRAVESLATPSGVGASRGGWELFFRTDPRGFSLSPAEISHVPLSGNECESREFVLQAQVLCEHGHAVLESEADIRWSTTGATEVVERLGQERPDADVMLDQFCRRLVGGLIPTASLSDVAVAMDHVRQLKN